MGKKIKGALTFVLLATLSLGGIAYFSSGFSNWTADGWRDRLTPVSSEEPPVSSEEPPVSSEEPFIEPITDKVEYRFEGSFFPLLDQPFLSGTGWSNYSAKTFTATSDVTVPPTTIKTNSGKYYSFTETTETSEIINHKILALGWTSASLPNIEMNHPALSTNFADKRYVYIEFQELWKNKSGTGGLELHNVEGPTAGAVSPLLFTRLEGQDQWNLQESLNPDLIAQYGDNTYSQWLIAFITNNNEFRVTLSGFELREF